MRKGILRTLLRTFTHPLHAQSAAPRSTASHRAIRTVARGVTHMRIRAAPPLGCTAAPTRVGALLGRQGELPVWLARLGGMYESRGDGVLEVLPGRSRVTTDEV